MSKLLLNDELEIHRKNKADLIINSYYNNDHNFIYEDAWYGYDRCFEVGYKCNKCTYEIVVSFWAKDDWENDKNLKFYYDDHLISPRLKGMTLYYFGESRILKDDEVNIISCNEWIIKNIIE